MRLFDPKKQVKRLLPDEQVARNIKEEVNRLTVEFNAYKDKIKLQKLELEESQQKYIESAYKTRSELLSEIGELEQRKIELEQSTNAKLLVNKIQEYNLKIEEVDARLENLNHKTKDLAYEKQALEKQAMDIQVVEKAIAGIFSSVQKFMFEIKDHQKEIKQMASTMQSLIDDFSHMLGEWNISAQKNQELTAQLENVIATQMNILEMKRIELDKKQRLIFSQQSALKTYAKDRRQ